MSYAGNFDFKIYDKSRRMRSVTERCIRKCGLLQRQTLRELNAAADAPAGRVAVSRLLLLLAIHSGVPGIMSTETTRKKLAEEGCPRTFRLVLDLLRPGFQGS